MSDAESRAAAWVAPLNHGMQACAIDSAVRQAAFLAQVLLESAEFQHLEEALGYSAQRLRQVWPQRFPDDATASAFSHNPPKLANKVYAGRMGNGDEASGDGWRYRGRGLLQLTGRDTYARFSQAIGIDAVSDPDLLLQPNGATLSAAWFWQAHGLNELADRTNGAPNDPHFVEISKRVNGGITGLAERQVYWARARLALGLHP
ncbi:hypothetical protein ACZ75_20255 [Massilia sp. NR 4-1]|nr:hypothetical protein ACZ75_20255 [Massilia sp. NR 4-1]